MQIEVSGKPKIESSEDNKLLFIEGYRMERAVPVSIRREDWKCLKLDSRKSYHFRLSETSSGPTDLYPYSELLRVSAGRSLIYDAALCRVHHRLLQSMAMREGVDHASLPLNYERVAEVRFPNAGTGHPVCQPLLAEHLIQVCPVCDRVEKAWVEKHRDSRSR
ncbi:hypothetical protein llg_03830 [Luteolibacter sp. LG18]|nr:hypothetical protein llg_03830 [Luteolibacter sp. LG18]